MGKTCPRTADGAYWAVVCQLVTIHGGKLMRLVTLFLIAALVSSSAFALPKGFNYHESKVPDFTLADPLTLENGDKVADADTWKNKRRAEIVDLFETHVYGCAPEDSSGVRFGDAEVNDNALGGAAIRKQLKIYFSGAKDGPQPTC